MSKSKWIVLLVSAATLIVVGLTLQDSTAQVNAPLAAPGPGPGGPLRPGPAGGPHPATAQSRPHMGMGGPGSLSPEEATEVLDFAKQHMPELYDQLQALQKENPRRYRMLLHSVSQVYFRVKRYPPEIRDSALTRHLAGAQIWRVTRDLRAATAPAEREKIMARLKELLAQRFDQDQLVKEYEVKRLTQQLDELKKEVDQRKANRATVLEEQLKNILTASTRPSEED